MQPFPFQSIAPSAIAERFEQYVKDPDSPSETRTTLVPFYQNVVAITGAGKTVILASAIETIRETLPIEPVILWVSKGKIVVEQTLTNLKSGKYSDLIPDYDVKALSECSKEDIETASRGLLLMATVATFNSRDRERRVFRLSLDDADHSLWDMLKLRETRDTMRRPMIVVYDEGHNLTDPQTELLLDLKPDAIISASATPITTPRLARIIQRLEEAGWNDEARSVRIDSQEVVGQGLIKSDLTLGGYETSMEVAVDDMLADIGETAAAVKALNAAFRPRAIYVCATNVAEGGYSRTHRDDPAQPFVQRKAPPILIWRHLTDRGIDPAKIAVWCNLDVNRTYPLPDEFRLFKGSENDYAELVNGNFDHIIFNQGLQEGWDEPQCYFAYIDKSMGSDVQIQQVIGRVLRQPGAQHYKDIRLNTPSFYVRINARTVFPSVLEQVREGLTAAAAQVRISSYVGKGGRKTVLLPPKKAKTVPKVSILADHARQEVAKVIAKMNDYRRDSGDNVKGKGAKIKVVRRVAQASGQDRLEWVEAEGANRITARSIFIRKTSQLYPRVVNVVDIESPKFDAMIEAGSIAAANIEELAERAVDTFLRHCSLVQKASDAQPVSGMIADPEWFVSFRNAIHDGYSGLNKLELDFATAIDRKRLPWARNPSRTQFGIPILKLGKSLTFYPDFLVWRGSTVYAIDTKGDHLITEDAWRKLFDIEQIGGGAKVVIRLVTEGEWTDEPTHRSNQGFTVWLPRGGGPFAIPCSDVDEAVAQALA